MLNGVGHDDFADRMIEAREHLERVGMQDKRKRRMGALSGGERQRVLLAQGLIPVPQLLSPKQPF